MPLKRRFLGSPVYLLVVIALAVSGSRCDGERSPEYGAAFLDGMKESPMMANARLVDSLILFDADEAPGDTAYIPTVLERNRTYTFVAMDSEAGRSLELTRVNYTDVQYELIPADDDPDGRSRTGTATLHPHFWLGSESAETPDGTASGVDYRDEPCEFMVGTLDEAGTEESRAIYVRTSCGCSGEDEGIDCSELFVARPR